MARRVHEGEIAYSSAEMARIIPRPSADAHKYSRGSAFVVGGCSLYPGAAALAACAAQRAGAGYTQVFCSPDAVHDVRAGRASLVVRPWDADELARCLQAARADRVAVLVGSGFCGEGRVERGLLDAVGETDVPIVVDGGALGLLASNMLHDGEAGFSRFLRGSAARVLTPHEGEGSRLCAACGVEAKEQKDRALALSAAYHAVVVLKGPRTVVAYGNCWHVMDQGGPELAKAGTGDVLAGLICGLLSQGVDAFEAACLGVRLHALAASCAARDLTDVAVIPEDVIAYVPSALKLMLDERFEGEAAVSN